MSFATKHKERDLAGRIFGRLTALEPIFGKPGIWRCTCECGETATAAYSLLVRGQITDCGCVRREESRTRSAGYRMVAVPAVQPIFNPQAKDEEYRNRALLDLARGQVCQNCFAEPAVSAHSNSQRHGKGKSHKAHDCFHAWLGQSCHAWLDQGAVGRDPTGTFEPTREDRMAMWRQAADRTLLALWRQGLIKVAR